MSIATKITRRIRLAGIVAAMVLVSAAAAQASLLVDFLPQPASRDMPEFIWDGFALTSGSGAFGTGFGPGAGDGDKLPEEQDIPGLQIVTPFVIDGLPGGVVNATAGSTTFYDVTLELTESPSADGRPPNSLFGIYIVQELTGGEFRILSTDPVGGGEEDYVVLLAGTITNAMIAGILNSDTGAVLSADITYTDGAIYYAAMERCNSTCLKGSFSWSLLNVDKPLSIIEGTPDYLDEFVANGTGQFSGTPEPATLVLLLSGACVVAMRRKRRTT